MKKITASILTTLLMLSMVFSSSVFAANEETSAWDSFLGLFSAKASADDVGVEYRGHIQNVGDYPTDGSWIQGPERLGTVGKSLRLEAFWIKLTDAPEGLHIKYEVHVQNIGWMAPVEDGKLAGTQGDSLRIEAIKISLVDDEGNVSGDYTVTYKGHIQNVGDTAWIKSGQQLGTTGSGLRLEALEVKIEKIAPDLTDYEAALAAVTEANYTKASWAAYQDVVEDNVMTEDNVQSEVDAATAIILDAQEDLVTVPVIAGMSATAQKTITVTGTELSKLAASMFTVANNTVTGVAASADGTSATVTLGTDLVPDTNTKVTTSIDGVAKEYTVKYSVAAIAVAIQAETFDTTLKGQKLTVLVDGVATTPDILTKAGYTLAFNAWDKNGANANTTVFGAATNVDGAIAVPQPKEEPYTVQVTLTKGSNIVSSPKATIKFMNLNNNATDISSYELNKIVSSAKGDQVTSGKLFIGEKAFFGKVVVGYGDAAAEIVASPTIGSDKYSVESSNTAVISTNDNDQLSAVGLGTADITITVGQAKKVVTLTVVGETRKATTITPKSETLTVVSGKDSTTPLYSSMTVVVKDQYGDPFQATYTTGKEITISTPTITGMSFDSITKGTGSVTNPSGKITTIGTDGEVTLKFKAESTLDIGKTGIVTFRDSDGNLLGSFNILTSGQNAVATQKLVVDKNAIATDTYGCAQDTTINSDLTTASRMGLMIGQYNKDGVSLGSLNDLTGYIVEFNKEIIAVKEAMNNAIPTAIDKDGDGVVTIPTNTTAYNRIAVTGLKAGSTTVVVREPINKTIVDQITVTVIKGVPYISNVSMLTPATYTSIGNVNYEQVLDREKTSADPIIKGITLSTSSVYKVRMVDIETSILLNGNTYGIGTLYLDKDSSGALDAGDEVLGKVVANWVKSDGTESDVSDVFAGQPVTNGDKGSVIFQVIDTINNDTVRGNASVKVDVPNLTQTVLAPTATPTSGFMGPNKKSVTLATATPGATIRYTTNGSTPTATTGTVYSAPFDLSADTVVKAIAVKTGMNNSSVATFEYTWDNTAPAKPTITSVAADTTSPGLTNDTTPAVVVGGVVAGDVVTVYADGTLVGTATATGTSVTITTDALTPGAIDITAKATDAALNVSDASDAFSLVVDTTAPTVTSAEITAVDEVTIVFDEAVNAAVGNFTDGKIATPTGTFTVDSISGSGTDTIVLTITGSDTITGSTTGTVDISTGVTDLAGNAFAGAPDRALAAGGF